jgi:excisionase family DNA binding protein
VSLENVDELAEAIADRLADRLDVRPLLSPAQVAERLGISDRGARELIASRVIASLKIGGSRRVEQKDVDAYIAQQRGEAA